MSEKAVVSVNEGKVRGIKQSSAFSGTEYYSFFGIPYGQPPINALRFKDPVKVKPWKDVYDATNEKQGCIQFSLITLEFLGAEDCLFNNIYTSKLPRKNEPLMPVIVNVHPGSFGFGSPHTQIYGSSEFIMHHNIVYVCISFRLHILGFLNLGLKECSGNQGIKDIVLSLRWINDNIQSFGGDPKNITLLGSSSGSAIVNILLLSPSAKGLFHKAVLMGGYLNNPLIPHQETNEDYAREVAINLGFDGNLHDNKKLLLFLKKQTPLSLIVGCRYCQVSLQESIAPIIPISVFCPSLDRSDILPDSPANLINTMTKVPIIIGFSQIESVMGFVRKLKPLTERNFKNSFRQNYFGWGYNLSEDVVRLINQEMEEFYLNGQPVEEATQSIKMNIQTDISLSDVYDSVINPISSALPCSVFVYKFEFEGNISSLHPIRELLDEPVTGTLHTSDLNYWNRFGDPQNKETHEMVEIFTKLITTFAKNGNPNYEGFPVEWRSCTPDHPCYLSINTPFAMIDAKLNDSGLEFWNKMKKKYKIE